MASYAYDNVVNFDRVIRVLTLLPGREEDPLHGELETCRLDSALAYEALSYCWGTGGMDAAIDCSRGSIKITKTLERALRVLRLEDKTRRLWIDQICINQDDIKERSSQVRLMYEIYSLAQRTVIWLGDDEKEQGPVVRMLFRDFQAMGADSRNYGLNVTARPAAISKNDLWNLVLNKGLEMDEEDQRMTINKNNPWFPTDDVLDQCKLPRRSSKAWPAFDALLRSHYFTRVWTLQEVLSSKEAVIIWGTTELPWASLRAAYHWSALNHCQWEDRRGSSHSPSLARVPFLELELDWFRGLCFKRLADLVTTAREGLQATDPRDQIYAFISLASDGKDFEIDYNKPMEDVFRDFSKYCILQCGCLDILNLAGLHRHEGFGLPSWAPSWNSRLSFWYNTTREKSFTTTFNEPLVPLAGEDKLKVRTLPYDWKSEGFADSPDQLIIKGYRPPNDQVRLVCSDRAHSVQHLGCVPMAAQYHDLCHTCASPSTVLREMVNCMTFARDRGQLDDHELLARLISFIVNSILIESEQFFKDPGLYVPSIELICLASDAMNDGVISTDSVFSDLSSESQEWFESLIQPFSILWGQEKVDKVFKAISDHWDPNKGTLFDASRMATGAGRKLFVTTQGRVGIGPALMTTADVIIIAYGGETPYVLRPIPGTQEYLFLGDCYIHNLMDGTATPKEDDPPAEWFCLSGEPRQTMDTAVGSSGAGEAGNIDLQGNIGGSQGDI